MFIGWSRIGLRMRNEPEPATGAADRPALYEWRVAGRIGPLVRSAFAALTAVAVPGFTVLTGTVQHPDDLQRLLDALDAHGSPAVDLRVTRRAPPTSTPDP